MFVSPAWFLALASVGFPLWGVILVFVDWDSGPTQCSCPVVALWRRYQGRDRNRDAVVAAGPVPAEDPANGAIVVHGGGGSMAGQDGVILKDIYTSR